jgi:phage terminase large subunit-like protein
LDLSSTTDITALVVVFPEDDLYTVLPFFWLPAENMRDRVLRDKVPYDVWAREGLIETTEGNVIHYGAVREKINQLNEIFNIREISFDRWGASKLVQDLEDDGFTMVPMGQGYASMNAPTQELMKLVLEQKIRHGGHPVLRWMADCVTVKQDPAGNIKPVKPDRRTSGKRIDGIVSLIMGIDRAIRHEGPSVYDSRGLVSI